MTAAVLAVDIQVEDPERTISVPAASIGNYAATRRRPGTHLPLSVRRSVPQQPGAQSRTVGKGLTVDLPGLHRVDQQIEPLTDGTWFAVCGAHVEPISDSYGGPWCLTCWPGVEFVDAPSQALLEQVLAGLRASGAEPPRMPIPAASPPWPDTEESR